MVIYGIPSQLMQHHQNHHEKCIMQLKQSCERIFHTTHYPTTYIESTTIKLNQLEIGNLGHEIHEKN